MLPHGRTIYKSNKPIKNFQIERMLKLFEMNEATMQVLFLAAQTNCSPTQSIYSVAHLTNWSEENLFLTYDWKCAPWPGPTFDSSLENCRLQLGEEAGVLLPQPVKLFSRTSFALLSQRLPWFLFFACLTSYVLVTTPCQICFC